jgi:hypothetical protein
MRRCPTLSAAFLFTLIVSLAAPAAMAAPRPATRQGPPTVTLIVSSGGTAVSAVEEYTTVTLSASATGAKAKVSPGAILFCDATKIYTVCNGPALLATAQLNAAGVAAVKLRLGVGLHKIFAEFPGTTSYEPANSAQQDLLVQGQFATDTTVAAKPTDATGSYSLAAVVTGAAESEFAWPPTGTVRFTDFNQRNQLLGTATLAPGSSGYSLSYVNMPLEVPAPVPPYSYSGVPSVYAIADMNGDGIPDLVTQTGVFLGNGDGTFQTEKLFPLYSNPAYAPKAVYAVDDFNEDGIPDVLVRYTRGDATILPSYMVLLGNGDGTFTVGPEVRGVATADSPNRFIVGDFNGDGHLDLISELDGSVEYEVSSGAPQVTRSKLYFAAGNGDGSFKNGGLIATGPSTGASFAPLAAGDFNGDGNLDVACGNGAGVQVFPGNGDGTFGKPIVTSQGGATPALTADLVVADYDEDGNLDLAFLDANNSNQPTIMFGAGAAQFGYPSVLGNGIASLQAIGEGDFNGDGIPDLMVAGSESYTTFLSNGDQTFQQMPGGEVVNTIDWLATGDITGAGLSDAVLSALVVPGKGNETLALTPNQILLNEGGIGSRAVLTGLVLPAGSGRHRVVASYQGDASNTTSGTGIELYAKQTATALKLTSKSGAGGTETLTATLSPYENHYSSTNGELVVFSAVTSSGNTIIGTGALASGVATFTFTPSSTLPQGASAVQADYSGDDSFTPAESPALSVAAVAAEPALARPKPEGAAISPKR